LDEHGNPARAEFIRTQCALASEGLSAERRQSLRIRERELLDQHRQAWCEAFGFPVEDAQFERGYPESLRQSEWPSRGFFESPASAYLSTVTELDLTGLRCGDAGIADFAEHARLPRLRKLLLNGNGITDTGASALAQASGLPALESLYLFHNAVGSAGRTALENSDRFRLGNLDFGEPAAGYSFSPGQTDVARREFLRTRLLPVIRGYFTKYPRLQSAMLCVAQYWSDEADDAVHGRVVVSELFEPTMEGVEAYGDDAARDPNIPNTPFKESEYHGGSCISLWGAGVPWDENNRAVPLWAAFAPEGGHQEYGAISEVYAPAVMFYRHGGYTILPMLRPQLDGVRSEWGGELGEEAE